MAKLKCQNPECGKIFEGRVQKNYVSKFCCNQCSADDRKNRPELYDAKSLGFQKGHKSWNTGIKGTKTGNFMIRNKTLKTGNVKRLRFVNIGIGENGVVEYERNDKHIWENENGPIPKGHVIYHKDGRTLNDDISNLDCILLGEALSRYSMLRDRVYNLKDKRHVKKIIKGCRVNDRRIQKILFEMNYDKCMGIAMRYAKDHDSAQDILSDSFIKVFKNIGTFKATGNLEGWIGRIVANTALDSIRKNKNTFVMDTNDMAYFDAMQSDASEYEFGEAEVKGIPVSQILKEIQNLSPSYKAVFNMFVFEDMSHKDIAEKLEIAEGTSKSNLSKARVILKDRVAKLILKENSRRQDVMDTCREIDIELKLELV